jgi:glyoxylase-like metal-dependent hydrolase (beta-lactamase superfamily II)
MLKSEIFKKILIFLFTLVGCEHFIWAQSLPMQVQEVAPNTYYVQGFSAVASKENKNFISNAGFVVTSEGVVVIDALGSPYLANLLIDEIKKITPLPIKFVFLTHYHADHIYGLQAFKEIGVQVIAQERGLDYIYSDTAKLRLQSSQQTLDPWINAQTTIVHADQWFKDEKTINLGDTEFHLIHVGPAHTPEDTVVFIPKTGVLFAGDLVFSGRIPYVGNADSAGWIASLDKLLKLPVKKIIPGHGSYAINANQDMLFTRNYLIYLRSAMRDAAINLDSFDEVYEKTDWSEYSGVKLFKQANRMNAYNIYLSIQNE